MKRSESEFATIRPYVERALQDINTYFKKRQELNEKEIKADWDRLAALPPGTWPKVKLVRLTEEQHLSPRGKPVAMQDCYAWPESSRVAAVWACKGGWTTEADGINVELNGLPIQSMDAANYQGQLDAMNKAAEQVKTILTAILADNAENFTASDATNDGPWSMPDGPAQWAKRFRVHVSTIKRRFDKQTIRNKKISTKSYLVHVDDLPGDVK